jgi:hypothetical protein
MKERLEHFPKLEDVVPRYETVHNLASFQIASLIADSFSGDISDSGRNLLDHIFVPPPDELVGHDGKMLCQLIAYAYRVHCPERPPPLHLDNGAIVYLDTWEEFNKELCGIKYGGAAWKENHNEFLRASKHGDFLGIGKSSPLYSLEECRSIRTQPVNSFNQRNLFRGLYCEELARAVYRNLLDDSERLEPDINPATGEEEAAIPTVVDPEYRDTMVSLDGKIFDRNTGAHVRNLEIKCMHCHEVVPPIYMAQIQQGMQTFKVEWCDIAFFQFDDKALKSQVFGGKFDGGEMLIHRVRRNAAYFRRMRIGIEAFARSELACARPPPAVKELKDGFAIESSIVYRSTNVMSSIPNGCARLRDAVNRASISANETAATSLLPK